MILTPSVTQADEAPKELPGGWRLVWHDEFNGGQLDTSKWTAGDLALNTGTVEYYTPEDIYVHDGVLTIRSQKRPMGGRQYTSGLVSTYGKFAITYGRFEICTRLSKGQGILSAQTLMPINKSGSWSPQIDIAELLGHEPNKIHMLHQYGTVDKHKHYGGVYVGPDFSNDFHIFAVEWEPDEIRWYVDGAMRFSTKDNIPHMPMNIILITEVGGEWAGSPTKKTVFPQYHDIDYVRVYAKANTNIEIAGSKISKNAI